MKPTISPMQRKITIHCIVVATSSCLLQLLPASCNHAVHRDGPEHLVQQCEAGYGACVPVVVVLARHHALVPDIIVR